MNVHISTKLKSRDNGFPARSSLFFLRYVRTSPRRRMGDGGRAPRIPTWALDRSQFRDPCFGFSTHGEDYVTRRTGDREGHRAGLNASEKKVSALIGNRTTIILLIQPVA